MTRETKRFFAVTIPIGLGGAVVAGLLNLGDTATFLATMGPVSLVMAIFILREPRDREHAKSPTGGRARSVSH